MASRTHIQRRNQEIKKIYNHLSKVERRKSDYIIEYISVNYFLDKTSIYAIITATDEIKPAPRQKDMSEAFKYIFKK